jgi:SAM-dependent methyltransferase
MHDTAMQFGKRFFDTYSPPGKVLAIADIGSQDVNGSLRSVAPPGATYTGVDFVEGRGVDVIITDPYALPFADNSLDMCVTSSCLEHSEFFWLLFLEMIRILKPSGLLYINVPSNGDFHRYPVDCWRFYPDSGVALQNWAARNGHNSALLESFIGNQGGYNWNDFVAVFVKDRQFASEHPNRIMDSFSGYTNGRRLDEESISNFRPIAESQAFWGYRAKKLVQKAVRKITRPPS